MPNTNLVIVSRPTILSESLAYEKLISMGQSALGSGLATERALLGITEEEWPEICTYIRDAGTVGDVAAQVMQQGGSWFRYRSDEAIRARALMFAAFSRELVKFSVSR